MTLTRVLAFAACLYLIAASARYRFLHPELTETQLFLKLPEAVGLR